MLDELDEDMDINENEIEEELSPSGSSESKNITEKKENFIRIAERRVNEAVKKLQLVGNLSNRNTYHYDAVQIEQIVEVLEAEIQALKMKFRVVETEKKSTFSFKS